MAQDPICGMQVDEKKGLSLEHEGQTYYFCSPHCKAKFQKDKGIADTGRSGRDGSHCCQPKAAWYTNKTLIVAAILILLSLSAEFIPFLVAFRQALGAYVRMIWWAILLGLILGGIIDHYIPRKYVTHMLARPGQKKNIFNAVILGFFMSACSHGILALAIQLYKKGASAPAVVAFLLASPWANLPLTLMLIGFFGLVKALYIILVAIIVAIISGLIFQGLESRQLIETNPNTFELDRHFSIRQDLRQRWQNTTWNSQKITSDLKGIYSGSVSLANMVLWWILIGMGLASLAGAYIPQDFFYQYMGPNPLGLTITLLVATILEVCSEGTAPLAFEIFRQTNALGNSFVFLMAGVATDYTEIGLLWHNVGKRTALWLPLVTVPQVILFGIIANMIF
jgi:hypothetical protein